MTAIPQEIGGEFLVNTTTESDQVLSTVTGLTDGGFVVTWIDDSGLGGDSSVPSIKAQVFDATGAEVGSEFLVNTTTADSLDSPTVTGLNNGGFVITWSNFSRGLGFSIEAQLFDATGAKVGGEFQVSSLSDGNGRFAATVTGLSHGGFVVTWAESSTIEAQMFDSTGAKVGSEFRVDPTTLGYIPGHPTVIGLSNGGFVITWHDSSSQSGDSSGYSIKAQVFDASGARVGSKLLVNTTTVGDQDSPTIAELSNGRFVIAWEDYGGLGGDASNSSIKAQVFSATGTKVGSEFLVNSTTEGYQDLPTVTGLNNGGFVITWRDGSGLGGDASNSSIKAQVFSATGTKVGSEFLVNSTIAGAQWLPSITGLNNGGFVVTWTDDSGLGVDSSDFSIKAQIFGMTDKAPYTYVTLDFPAFGINDAGQIVGPYTTNGLPLVGSRSFPYAYGINDAGQIVGTYNGSDGTHGFLYSGGIYTQLDDPLADPVNGTSAFGINATGQIVGYYYANGLYHGFLYSGGIYTTLDDPLATQGTYAFGINDTGQIVGIYNGSDGQHGFLYSGGIYTTLDDPLGIDTHAYGINDAGQIVGQYSTATAAPTASFTAAAFTQRSTTP